MSNYEKMTLVELKVIAKELSIKNISKKKKSELIEAIKEVKPADLINAQENSLEQNTIEKDGIVLREKISVKVTEPVKGIESEVKAKVYHNPYQDRNYDNRVKKINVSENNQDIELNNTENKVINNPYRDRNYDNRVSSPEKSIDESIDINEKKEEFKTLVSTSENSRGILEILESNSFGFLRGQNYLTGDDDIYVSPSQIRRFNLRTGDEVIGKVREAKDGEKFRALLYVEKINGDMPEVAINRKSFEKLTPIYPNERLRLETDFSGDVSSRLMDIVCPIGKGQRGMIVAPPKAGKTTMLKRVAQNLMKNYPDITLIMLLVDERPEEVTDMKRSIRGEVIYSTFDEEPQNHAKVSRIVLERAKRLVEHGKDVIILMDSLTRLSRAYNLTVTPSGRTLSGGLDPGALVMPKKFFGAARNIEEGGSLTILATALVDTGSRMDDMIFEEFKGTGNMEVHLDRKLQERRIFPAIDIYKSGTRKDNLLLDSDERVVADAIRKTMYREEQAESTTERLINLLYKTKNNKEFIEMYRALMNKQK
ncbi:transcription termination factor Rho [uncultured Clostridium sp.]|uniref:transcription termination factor Rho n=1 Tax=uncultured Clostridium sp. TaxID=59620 RepID=UPI002626EEA8|nr:transcription termination factor Rho [uncultured Clostridium sp.]